MLKAGIVFLWAAWRVFPAAAQPVAPAEAFLHSVYKARRDKVAQSLQGGVAVLYARGEEDRDGYKQDADFYYLTGINEAGAVLILAPGERTHKEFLFLPSRDPEAERWTGERLPLGSLLKKETGFEKVRRLASLNGTVTRLAKRHNTLIVLNQPGSLEGPNSPEKELYGKIQGRLGATSVIDKSELLPAIRAVKEDGELALIRRAISATLAAQSAAAAAIRPGVEENWLASLIDVEFKRSGALRPAFPSIIGSGENSTILHYPRHAKRVESGDLVVVDIGAEIGGYAADVTRTYPADGFFSPEAKKVYAAVLRAQEAALALVKPGVYFEDLQAASEKVLEEAGYGDYFIHGLGHFVGLEVHDAGHYDEPLKAGMVITLEPGVYIAEKKIGVRIEDMVLVTNKGAELMTSALPRQTGEIEELMRREKAR